MRPHRNLARNLPLFCSTLCVLLLMAAPAFAGDKSDYLTEEFHQTYPLSADGRVAVSNINGPVHISGWDRNEVKVDAIKYARSKERLDEAKIKVDASSSQVSIHTEYPDRDRDWRKGGYDNPASIEYTITVPRGARLDKIELINGGLDIQGMAGEVRATCINGSLDAKGLSGRVDLSTVNGPVKAHLDRVAASPMELSSVNGSVTLTIPSDAKAEIEASTVHGSINTDFGLHVNNHQFVGHDLRGEIGGGGTRIKLSNVNGPIDIHRANDGKAMSPVKDLNRADEDDDDKI